MSGWTSHLARRGVEAAFSDEPGQNPEFNVHGWGLVLLVVTGLVFFALSFSINYTFGLVVPALAAVEDQNPDIYVRIDTDPGAPKPTGDVEQPLAPARPITSKLRTTIRHLRARAGRWSHFRGVSMFVVWSLSSAILTSILSAPLGRSFVGRSIAQILAQTILANLEMAWIHIVVSEPSPKRWYQRIPRRSSWRKIAPVAALRSLAHQTSFYLPLALGRCFKVLRPGDRSNMVWLSDELPPAKALGGASAVLLATLTAAVLIEQPATMIFTRIAASMLPEEDETIVPFDRTFGGKVTPEILGGGRVGILEAWKSFDWPSRVRYLKVIGKAILMQIALGTVFGLIFLGEAYLVLGEAFNTAVVAMASSA